MSTSSSQPSIVIDAQELVAHADRVASDVATSDDETLATVASLINSGKVQFCGALAGATIKDTPRLNPCPETPDKEMAHASTSMV